MAKATLVVSLFLYQSLSPKSNTHKDRLDIILNLDLEALAE